MQICICFYRKIRSGAIFRICSKLAAIFHGKNMLKLYNKMARHLTDLNVAVNLE